jgi:DNA-directed RNA polymerase subunit M/transcription elongation factor TFIIS
MSKRILADQLQQFLHNLQTVSSHPSVAKEWTANSELAAEFDKLSDILPKGNTRSISLQMIDQFVIQNNTRPDLWLKYLKNADYCKDLISDMRKQAKKGKRIELLFERHPELKLDSNAMASEPIGVQAQKEKKLEEAKKRTDDIFANDLSAAEMKDLSFVCEKCGVGGQIKTKTQQVRKGDEMPTIATKCKKCGHENIIS